MQFIFLPILGFAQGASPLISYNFGAKKIDRVNSAFKFLILVSTAYSLLFYLALAITPNTFVTIFNSDPKLLELSPRIVSLFFLGMSIIGIKLLAKIHLWL